MSFIVIIGYITGTLWYIRYSKQERKQKINQHTTYRRKKIKGKQNQHIVSRKGKKHEISEEHAEGLKE